MIQNELTDDRYLRLRLQTHTGAKQLSDGMILTDWYRPTPNIPSFVRVAYDAQGMHGLHRTYFTAATARYAREAGCWYWHVVLPPATRSGFTKQGKSEKKLSLRTFMRADSYLDLYSVNPREYRTEFTEKFAGERFDAPVLHPTRPWRLLSWHRRGTFNSVRGNYANRFIRYWVHADEAQKRLPNLERSEQLAQRARPGSRRGGAIVTRYRNGKVEWSVDLDLKDGSHTGGLPIHLVPGGLRGRMKGEETSESAAFTAVNRALKRLGCTPQLYVPEGLERYVTISERSIRPKLMEEVDTPLNLRPV